MDPTWARLKRIADLIAAHVDADDEIKRELRDLLPAFDNSSGPFVIYREKIQGAIYWADIYFDPQELERNGGSERVRGFLYRDIREAMEQAQQLQRRKHNGGDEAT
jgi:hypothetical protein